MSICLLRAASLVHKRIAYTKLSATRLNHQCRKRQFESFSSLWSTPVSSTTDHVTAVKVKETPVFCNLHYLFCHSPMASTCSSNSLVFGKCTNSDLTLKKPVHNVFIHKMSTDLPDERRLNEEELLELIKTDEVMLIDVRSPVEVKATGTLPKSFHIPITEYVTAMKVPDRMFREKYGFDKPRPDDPVVFVCSSGARSFKALRAALQLGFTKARMFDGNFNELVKQMSGY